MANNYFTFDNFFVPGTVARAEAVNAQFLSIAAAFDLLPTTTLSLSRNTTTLGVESGAGNSYVITMPKTRTVQSNGAEVVFFATHTNTGATTATVDGLAVTPIVRTDGQPLVAGDILNGVAYAMRFDNTNSRYQMMTPSTSYFANTGAAAASAVAAASSEALAQEFAENPEDVAITGYPGLFSAHHWAIKAGINTFDPAANQTITGAWTFGALTATSYDGIAAANLVDKSATETITGAWTFGALTATSYDGIAAANLVDKSVAETITGAWTFNVLNATTIAGITATNLLDKSAAETITGAWDFSDFTTNTIKANAGVGIGINFNTQENLRTVDESLTDSASGAEVRGVDDVFRPVGFNVVVEKEITGANYTLAQADQGKLIYYNEATARTLTINTSTDIPIGAFYAYEVGAASGVLTCTAGAGVVFTYWNGTMYADTAAAGSVTIGFGQGTIRKRSDTSYVITGSNIS